MTNNHLADLARAAAAKTTMTWEEIATRVEAALEADGSKASKILEEYAHNVGKEELTDIEKREALLLAVLRPS
mgnify:CR=1 FL=1